MGRPKRTLPLSNNVKRILSVDWDFFFPIPYDDDDYLYDWGHQENPLYISSTLWSIRAAMFIRAKKKLPKTNGAEQDFWKNFNQLNLSKINLYYADSHVKITDLQPILSSFYYVVDNYDAHHDCYVTPEQSIKDRYVDCSSWTLKFWSSKGSIHWIYPQWMDKRRIKADQPVCVMASSKFVENPTPYRAPVYDAVFVCRSGAWTPPWTDEQFLQFVADCPCKDKINLDSLKKREFNFRAVKEFAAKLNSMTDIPKSE